SDLPGGCDAPSQHVPRANPSLPPYLVLLRVGFALPAALLRRRCALTAPFHPYPSVAARAVCFLWHFPSNDPTLAKATMRHPPGRYPAHCSAEFGLSSPAARRRRERPSGPAANKVIIFDARTSKLGLQTSDFEGARRPKPDAEVRVRHSTAEACYPAPFMIHHTAKIIEIIAVLGAFSSVSYYALCLWSAAGFLRERKAANEGARPTQFVPPVSIVKPLKVTDPELYGSFRCHCLQHYPQ